VVPGEEEPEAKSGFAGLGSMVSDVDAVIGKAEQSTARNLSAGVAGGSPLPSRPQSPAASSARGAGQPGPRHQTGSAAGRWLLGLGAAAGVLWVLSNLSDHASQRQPQTTQGQMQVATQTNSETQTSISEERPPFGTNQVLGSDQLRYCLAEEIRLEAARTVVNNYAESQVARFNAMVEDYNGRCGDFRYRRGALEGARTEVEGHRPKLEAEGRSRF